MKSVPHVVATGMNKSELRLGKNSRGINMSITKSCWNLKKESGGRTHLDKCSKIIFSYSTYILNLLSSLQSMKNQCCHSVLINKHRQMIFGGLKTLQKDLIKRNYLVSIVRVTSRQSLQISTKVKGLTKVMEGFDIQILHKVKPQVKSLKDNNNG